MWDRTLRLLLPCLIYAMVLIPIMAYISNSSDSAVDALTELAAAAEEDPEAEAETVIVKVSAPHCVLGSHTCNAMVQTCSNYIDDVKEVW